jgi:NAD(P)-dependent dehydrogenase (short-subunit alcohol dehydrogenase family)
VTSTVAGAGGRPMTTRHALAVGTSGMLAGASRGLAERGWQVTMVARQRRRLDAARAGLPALHPVAVDYTDARAFDDALTAAVDNRGAITLALCWIRGSAPGALAAVAAAVADGGRLVHVLGSAARDPSTLGSEALLTQERLRYQRVMLGFAVEGRRSRWLTDAKISAGALAAVDDPRLDPHVVGQLRPWSARP